MSMSRNNLAPVAPSMCYILSVPRETESGNFFVEGVPKVNPPFQGHVWAESLSNQMCFLYGGESPAVQDPIMWLQLGARLGSHSMIQSSLCAAVRDLWNHSGHIVNSCPARSSAWIQGRNSNRPVERLALHCEVWRTVLDMALCGSAFV